MTENPPQIPEQVALKGAELKTPAGIKHLEGLLAEKLEPSIKSQTNIRTDELVVRENEFLNSELAKKGGFLGIGGRKIDSSDQDDLMVILNILYPAQAALNAYRITMGALIKASGYSFPEEWNGKKLHQALSKRPMDLAALNQRQILFGEYAVIPLLKKIVDQEKANKKEIEVGEYAELDFAVDTNTGKRPTNQDYIGYAIPFNPEEAVRNGQTFGEEEALQLNKGSLFVVADGLGGHLRGDLASLLAVQSTLDNFCSYKTVENPIPFMQKSLIEANKRVYEGDPDNLGKMGTTIAAALIKGHDLYTAHVGDSRVYVLRDNNLIQLTRDHSLREVNPDAAQNILTDALGISNNLNPKGKVGGPYQLKKGDQILICTDGLWDPLKSDVIKKILKDNKNTTNAVSQLIDAALKAGGTDNISVSLIRIKELVRAGKVKIEKGQQNVPSVSESATADQLLNEEPTSADQFVAESSTPVLPKDADIEEEAKRITQRIKELSVFRKGESREDSEKRYKELASLDRQLIRMFADNEIYQHREEANQRLYETQKTIPQYENKDPEQRDLYRKLLEACTEAPGLAESYSKYIVAIDQFDASSDPNKWRLDSEVGKADTDAFLDFHHRRNVALNLINNKILFERMQRAGGGRNYYDYQAFDRWHQQATTVPPDQARADINQLLTKDLKDIEEEIEKQACWSEFHRILADRAGIEIVPGMFGEYAGLVEIK